MNIFLVCMCWCGWWRAVSRHIARKHHIIISHHIKLWPRVETQCWAAENPSPDICSSAIADQKFVMKLIIFNSRDPEPGSSSRFDKMNILIQHAVIMSFVDICSFVNFVFPIHLTMANEGATTCLREAYQ